MTTATLAAGNPTMDAVDRPRRSPGRAGRPALRCDGIQGAGAGDGNADGIDGGRRSRARPARSTRPGGSGRRETWTVRWRSSPAWTRRRRRRRRPGGPSPSGTQLVKRRFGGGPVMVYSQGTGRARCAGAHQRRRKRWRSRRSWGCAGGRARSSRGAASGACGPWPEARDGHGQRGHHRAEGPVTPWGDTVEGVGRPSQGSGQGPPGRLPLPRRGGGLVHGLRRQ